MLICWDLMVSLTVELATITQTNTTSQLLKTLLRRMYHNFGFYLISHPFQPLDA